MRDKFPAYYRIHKEDLVEKFDYCAFIFDACVLLDIFRLKKELAEQVFDVIDHLKEQIHIPYHAAEEYNKNIHEVLKTQIQNIDKADNDFNSFISSLQGKRSQPYISKSSENLIGKLKKQISNDFANQKNYLTQQLLYGDYQNRLSDLLNGCVMEPFSTIELKTIEKEGIKRYENKIPPGWKDAKKGDNRYGDLINWKEMLRFAKNSHKNLVFVTSDMKEDWVCKEKGMTICPLYDLLHEFYTEMGNNEQFFLILSLDKFLELAHEKDTQVVSEDTVKGVKNFIDNLEENSTHTMLKYDILSHEKAVPICLPKKGEIINKYSENAFFSAKKDVKNIILDLSQKSVEGLEDIQPKVKTSLNCVSMIDKKSIDRGKDKLKEEKIHKTIDNDKQQIQDDNR